MGSHEEIRKSAEEIVDEFTKLTSDLPEIAEQYYLGENVNIVRPDGEPTPEEERKDFRRRFLEIAPGTSEEGRVRVEVARWT